MLLQGLKAHGEFFVYRPFDSVPDVHIRVLEQAVIRPLSDQAAILILPALPCGFRIQDPVRLLEASAGDLCEKPLSQLPGPAHDDKEKPRKEEQIDLFEKAAFDVRIILKRHTVCNGRRDAEPVILENLHQRPAAIRKPIQDIHPAAIVSDNVILQRLRFIGN